MITTINEFRNMPENKTKIVLVKYLSDDFEAMGYIPGNSKMVTILRPKHNSVMKDSESYSLDNMKEIKLANEADFDEYRIEMSQFNKPEYIWEKPVSNLTENIENDRYMFFSNLEQMKRQITYLLEFDKNEVENILSNGHDWAQDHIAECKTNLDQVFDFLMNELKADKNIENTNENHNNELLINASNLLKKYKDSPMWNNIISQLNEDDIDYITWNDLEILNYYLTNYNDED